MSNLAKGKIIIGVTPHRGQRAKGKKVEEGNKMEEKVKKDEWVGDVGGRGERNGGGGEAMLIKMTR